MAAVGQPMLWLIAVLVMPSCDACESIAGLPYFSRIPRVIRLSEFCIISLSALAREVVAVFG